MMSRFDVREIEAVTRVIRSGKLSRFFEDFRGGTENQSFEKEFAEYIGTKHAIAVSNGTVSLEIALKAMDIGKGDEVITTPLSFIATATAILSVGATPVFADIDGNTLNINPEEVEEAITKKTQAIIPVSLVGYPAEMPRIMEIAAENDLFVLEDAAQALGAEINGKKIGTFGDMGSFSFQETKQITTLGEGGMIVTDSDVLAEACRNIRNHGNYYGNLTKSVSTNARMTEAQAAFGRVQLTKLDMFNKLQIENAEYFLANLPKAMDPIYSNIPGNYKPVYLLIAVGFAVKPSTRTELLETLKREGISKGVPGQNVGYYKSLMYESAIVRERCKKPVECPIAEIMRDCVVVFDIHRWRSRGLVDKTLEVLNDFFEVKENE